MHYVNHPIQIFSDDTKMCQIRDCSLCRYTQFFTKCKVWKPEYTFLYKKTLLPVIRFLLLARKGNNLFALLPRDVLYIIISYVAKYFRYANAFGLYCDSCLLIKFKAPKCYYCASKCYKIIGRDCTRINFNDVCCSECKIPLTVCYNCMKRICYRCNEIKNFKRLS